MSDDDDADDTRAKLSEHGMIPAMLTLGSGDQLGGGLKMEAGEDPVVRLVFATDPTDRVLELSLSRYDLQKLLAQ